MTRPQTQDTIETATDNLGCPETSDFGPGNLRKPTSQYQALAAGGRMRFLGRRFAARFGPNRCSESGNLFSRAPSHGKNLGLTCDLVDKPLAGLRYRRQAGRSL